MTQQRRFTSKVRPSRHAAWGLASLLLGGCTSAELELPLTHPGYPHARDGRVARTEALTTAYGLDPGASEQTASSDEHAHHRHETHVAPAELGESAKEASEPARLAAFTCPMHPEIVRSEPGKCPICSMSLVPKKDAK